jgi:hypothetical protein
VLGVAGETRTGIPRYGRGVDELVAWLIAVGVVIGVVGGIALLRSHPLDLPTGSFSIFDELYNPAGQRPHIEIQQHEERGEPRPSSDDKPWSDDDLVDGDTDPDSA